MSSNIFLSSRLLDFDYKIKSFWLQNLLVFDYTHIRQLYITPEVNDTFFSQSFIFSLCFILDSFCCMSLNPLLFFFFAVPNLLLITSNIFLLQVQNFSTAKFPFWKLSSFLSSLHSFLLKMSSLSCMPLFLPSDYWLVLDSMFLSLGAEFFGISLISIRFCPDMQLSS